MAGVYLNLLYSKIGHIVAQHARTRSNTLKHAETCSNRNRTGTTRSGHDSFVGHVVLAICLVAGTPPLVCCIRELQPATRHIVVSSSLCVCVRMCAYVEPSRSVRSNWVSGTSSVSARRSASHVPCFPHVPSRSIETGLSTTTLSFTVA